MANINGINSGIDYSVFFGSSSAPSTNGMDLSSYMSIKNGSYRKLLKNYYSSQKQEIRSGTGDPGSRLTKIRSTADQLQKKADALSADKLWAAQDVAEEESGRTKNVLRDPDAAVKAVKDFVEAYNATLDAASSSETKSVLRSGGWMDNMSRKNSRLLNEAGISVGSDGRLSVDEEALKTANVTTLKDLFQGVDSYAARVSAKAEAISKAAAGTAATYDSSGAWSKDLNTIASSRINSVIGNTEEKEASGSKARSEAEKRLSGLKEKRDQLKRELKNAVGYDAQRSCESQIAKLDKEIRDNENRLKYL